MELPDIFDADEIAIDVETRDPNLKVKGPGWPTCDGEVVGYAIAVSGWKCYIPVGHAGGGNLDKRIVSKWLKKYLSHLLTKSCITPSTTLVGFAPWALRLRAA